MSIIPEKYQDIVESKATAYVATIGPKGEPHVSPVLFLWDGERFLISMNKVRQKHRNVVREPRIALSIADPANPFRSLEIRGVVVGIEDDADYEYSNRMSRKYLGRDVAPEEKMPGEERVAVFVEPRRVFSFPFEEQK